MNIQRMLQELYAEREQINEAITTLEKLYSGRGRGPGRPRKNAAETDHSTKTTKGERNKDVE